MSLLDSLLQKDDPLKKVENGKTYLHYSVLKKWEHNDAARLMSAEGWDRLKKSLKKNGIKDALQIDEDGTVYDGNHRLDGVIAWITAGVTNADNGTSLEWVPVDIHRVPFSFEEAVQIAAEGNGDKDFAYWNKDFIANHPELFEQYKDDFVFNIEDAPLFDDNFDFSDELIEDNDEPLTTTKKENCSICTVYHNANHETTQTS